MDFNTSREYPFFTIDEGSYYYCFVLSAVDKVVYRTLLRSVLSQKCIAYNNGILINNIREDSLARKVGQLSLSTTKRSLERLADMGLIIKVSRNNRRNNQYIVGFRHPDGCKRLYFLNYLSAKFDDLIAENVENQNTSCPEIDIRSYCLKEEWKNFIRKNLNKPHTLFGTHLENRLTIMELMFGFREYYEKPLEKLDSLSNLTAQNELSTSSKIAI